MNNKIKSKVQVAMTSEDHKNSFNLGMSRLTLSLLFHVFICLYDSLSPAAGGHSLDVFEKDSCV